MRSLLSKTFPKYIGTFKYKASNTGKTTEPSVDETKVLDIYLYSFEIIDNYIYIIIY